MGREQRANTSNVMPAIEAVRPAQSRRGEVLIGPGR